jgi:hypothetical protein
VVDLPIGDSEKDLSTDRLFLVVISGKHHRGREVKGGPKPGPKNNHGWQHPETLGSTFQTSLKLGHTQTTHVCFFCGLLEDIGTIFGAFTVGSGPRFPPCFSRTKQGAWPSVWDFLHHRKCSRCNSVSNGVPANIGSHEETKFDLQQTDGI